MKFGNKEFPYSYSQDRLYNECPYKYKLRYAEGIKEPTNTNLELGSAIHTLIENIDKLDGLTDLPAMEVIVQQKGILYYNKLVKELTALFSGLEVVAHEFHLNDNEDQCFIDLIYIDKDGKPVLVDFKSTKKPKTDDSILEEGQLIFYAHMYSKYTGIKLEDIRVQYINILSYLSEYLNHYDQCS